MISSDKHPVKESPIDRTDRKSRRSTDQVHVALDNEKENNPRDVKMPTTLNKRNMNGKELECKHSKAKRRKTVPCDGSDAKNNTKDANINVAESGDAANSSILGKIKEKSKNEQSEFSDTMRDLSEQGKKTRIESSTKRRRSLPAPVSSSSMIDRRERDGSKTLKDTKSEKGLKEKNTKPRGVATRLRRSLDEGLEHAASNENVSKSEAANENDGDIHSKPLEQELRTKGKHKNKILPSTPSSKGAASPGSTCKSTQTKKSTPGNKKKEQKSKGMNIFMSSCVIFNHIINS